MLTNKTVKFFSPPALAIRQFFVRHDHTRTHGVRIRKHAATRENKIWIRTDFKKRLEAQTQGMIRIESLSVPPILILLIWDDFFHAGCLLSSRKSDTRLPT